MKQQKWNDDDKRRFHEQRLRAQRIPAQKDNGPLQQEWEDDPGSDEYSH